MRGFTILFGATLIAYALANCKAGGRPPSGGPQPGEEKPPETPEGMPEETPEKTPEETPEKTPEETPEKAPEETPEKTPEETPKKPSEKKRPKKPSKKQRPSKPSKPGSGGETFNCGGDKISVEEREAITKRHNELRSSLVKGNEKNKDGQMMPKGKEMFKLTYNCTLEKQAQAWMDRCEFDHSPSDSRPDAGENLYYFAETRIEDDRLKKAGIEATDSWWDELKEDYPNNPSNELNNHATSQGVVLHWTQQAWGLTSSIGCGKSVCPKSDYTYVYINCQYYPRGNWMGDKIYELGEPCPTSKCPSGSTCSQSEGLCLKSK